MQRNIVFSHLLNFYDMLLLTTFILACVLAFPLLLKRERREHDLLLALFVLSQGVYALYSVLLYSETIGPVTKSLLFPFHKIPFLFILGTQGLLLWWYARAMMGFPVAYRSKSAFAMLGFTLFTVLFNTLLSYMISGEVHILVACAWLLSIGSVLLGFRALHQLHGYELRLPFIHSSMLRHSLTWLKVVAIGFVAVWVMTLLAIFADLAGERGIAHGLYLTRHVPPLVLIAAMVVYSQAHAVTTQPDLSSADDSDNINSDAAAYVVNQKLALQLDDLMHRVRVYQDPELRLEGLADSMDISPRSLSTILNKHYHKSFYEFVNHFRVLDAETQLKDPGNQQKPIQRVFEDAGFNSKTTFNALFKRHTGKTPSEFRKSTMSVPMQKVQEQS